MQAGRRPCASAYASDVELRQLEVFKVVAEFGSLSRAADQLHLAQPVLSRHIKALETELRVPLFTRTGRGMELTEAGAELLRRGSGMVESVRRLRDDLRSFDGVPRGRVVVGLVPTVSSVIAGQLAATTLERFPEVALRIVEGYSGHLVDWIHRGELDLAVVYGDGTPAHLVTHPVGTERILALSAAGQGIEDGGAINFEQLARLPLALPGPGHGLRNLVERAAAERGVELNIVVESDSFRVLLDIVKRGLAVTALPASAVVAARPAGLRSASVTNPPVQRTLALAQPIGQAPTIAMKAIHSLLLEQVGRLTQRRG